MSMVSTPFSVSVEISTPDTGMDTATDADSVKVMMVNITMSGMTAIKAINLFLMPRLRSPVCIFCQVPRKDKRVRR